MATTTFHVSNRGAGRRTLFFHEGDYRHFLRLLAYSLPRHAVDLLAFTLMPNHFHLLLTQEIPYALSGLLQEVCRPYSRSLNARTNERGHRFESRYNLVPLFHHQDVLDISRTIHRAPLLAGLVSSPAEWEYGSYRHYLGVGESPASVERLLSAAGGVEAYRRFVEEDAPLPRTAATHPTPSRP